MFQAFWMGIPSRVSRRAAPGLDTWIELSEVLDVPGVLDRHPVLCLQAHGARPGDVEDPERALPYG